jgi:single stranded DNA-binding protein
MVHNQLTIIGNLGNDAVKNISSGGQPVINMSVGVNDDYKKADGTWENRTIWYDCVLWADRKVDDLQKGNIVAITGTPRPNTYPKRDGTTGFSIRVNVEGIRVIHKRQATAPIEQQSQQPTAQQQVSAPPQQSNDVDDLPF